MVTPAGSSVPDTITGVLNRLSVARSVTIPSGTTLFNPVPAGTRMAMRRKCQNPFAAAIPPKTPSRPLHLGRIRGVAVFLLEQVTLRNIL